MAKLQQRGVDICSRAVIKSVPVKRNRSSVRGGSLGRTEAPLLSARLREDRPRVASACRRLARCIVTRGLRPGDPFPAQPELRAELGMSNDTLVYAMRLLRQSGIVSRKERFRTRVADLAPLARIGWTVGVAGPAAQGPGFSVFYADLMQRLLSALTRAGCTCRTYFRIPTPHWPENRLADYPQLEQDVREGRVDGILVLTNLALEEQRDLLREDIPVCHLGEWPQMPSAVLLDATEMVRHAYGLMRERGCRRILLVDTLAALGDSAPTAVLRRVAAMAGGPKCETLSVTATADTGPEIAGCLLQRPPRERPDGLIVTADHIAMWMAAAIAAAGGDHPLLAARTNMHVPLHFALPVIRYEVDSEALVAEACAMMQTRLLNPAAPVEVRRCGARPPCGEEGDHPGELGDSLGLDQQGRPQPQVMEFVTV